MPNRFPYCTCCVHWPREHIDELTSMIDNAHEITYKYFRQLVVRADLAYLLDRLGYARNKRSGLTIQNDYAVSFFKSTVFGEPCVFITHSAIEYVFTHADI